MPPPSKPETPSSPQAQAPTYLAPSDGSTAKLGYYLNLPPAANGLVPKGINPPIVVAGSLFYSYFTPLKVDSCGGSIGTTTTGLIYEGLIPAPMDNRSGLLYILSGVASDFIAVGTQGVLQAGVTTTGSAAGQSATALQLKTFLGKGAIAQHPKIRTWRTIH